MEPNLRAYGFRWSVAGNGGRPMPVPIRIPVASGQAFNVNAGAQGVKLGAGDPVARNSSGAVQLAVGEEDTSAPFYGIVVGVEPYWNGKVMHQEPFLPSGIAYGSGLTPAEKRSAVLVVPLDAGVWEIEVDDNVTATTEAGYRALVGNNVDMILTGVSGQDRAYPKLDISTAATTNSLHLRIVDVSPTMMNQNFAELGVKLLVKANIVQEPWSSTTGT